MIFKTQQIDRCIVLTVAFLFRSLPFISMEKCIFYGKKFVDFQGLCPFTVLFSYCLGFSVRFGSLIKRILESTKSTLERGR